MEHDSVRRSYDKVAEDYLAGFRDELAGKPYDRALLEALIERTEPGTAIADLGCGPGHVTAWLAGHGVPATGIDLAPNMVAAACREFPEADFRQGDLLDLPAKDGEFGAAVALYSIIHLAADELPRAFQEVRRVLRPDGLLLVAFHTGDEVRHLDDWFGHEVDVDFRFFTTRHVVGELERSGFDIDVNLERRNHPEEVATRRAYVVARRREPSV
jgi:SAM-dependent methyltransferase